MARDISESSAEPRWARFIDVLWLLFAILGVIVAISGGFRQSIAGVRISVTSPYPLLLWSAGLVLFRQVAAPQRGSYRDWAVSVAQWLRRTEVQSAAAVVVGTRLPILLVGYLAVCLFGYVDGRPPLRHFNNELLNLPVRWDAGWYLQIVTDGYRFIPNEPEVQQNIVFFPAYPLLVRLVGRLFGGHMTGYVCAGLAVSFASFFGALLYLYAFARAYLDDNKARYALWLIASYPFALFFGAIYTESLFLLAAVASFYHMKKAQFWRAMSWGLLAGLTRPNGAALSIPLAMLAVSPGLMAAAAPRVRSFDPHTVPESSTPGLVARALATAAMPAVGLLIYVAFVWHLTGDPFAWARGHAAWERTFEPLTRIVAKQYSFIEHAGLSAYLAVGGYDVLNMLGAIFALAAVWSVGRQMGLAYAALILVVTVPPIASGGWLSAGRFSSVLFPMFVWLAAAIPERHRIAWIVGFTSFQALNAALFYTWRPLF
jgi:Mannosyltransferase (PIG-V)